MVDILQLLLETISYISIRFFILFGTCCTSFDRLKLFRKDITRAQRALGLASANLQYEKWKTELIFFSKNWTYIVGFGIKFSKIRNSIKNNSLTNLCSSSHQINVVFKKFELSPVSTVSSTGCFLIYNQLYLEYI